MFISQSKIVITKSSYAHDESIDMHNINPCFLNRKNWISNPPLNLYEAASHYLAHQISRLPTTLVNHVQRIALHAAAKNPEQTYAALLDLYLILGEKGEKLRKRLLFQCKEVLEDDQYQVISALTIHSNNTQNEYPLLPHSILCKKPSSNNLVAKSNLHQEQLLQDVIDEGRHLVDCGQLDEAQTLLEQALIKSPERADIATDLLEIYRYTRNKNALSETLKQLAATPFKDTEKWETLASELD
ncbi:MAG: hypothetical protein GXP14_14250 [Gammaproteobacteria bacterium]|nr:hypothetical protein [Gammaproteobacteria bacterium]